MLIAGTWTAVPQDAYAGGETRSLSLFFRNTGERLQVTYMINGRYVPSAMQKLNRFLRDWRRNEVIRIDPRTIDLMWELHADLGSRAPIHIVCGYRSPRTNSFLKRIGRNVARKSQHMAGKAIDLYFPDVSTEKIRNSALVRRVGGVGYYRRGGGPAGFVHIDSGRVRQWPRLPASQLAKIMRDYRGTVKRRLNRADQTLIAEANTKNAKPEPVGPTLYDSGDEDEDTLDSAALPKKGKAVASAIGAPLPRSKPEIPADADEQDRPGDPRRGAPPGHRSLAVHRWRRIGRSATHCCCRTPKG